MEQQNEKYIQMTTQPVSRLVNRMAIPSIVGMLVSSFYNLVDTAFVGRISTNATAGVGVVFSYSALVQALAFYFGHGSGNFISRALGAQKKREAEQMSAFGFFCCMGLGVLIMLFGLTNMERVCTFLGATPACLPDAKAYMQFICFGTPFVMCSFILNVQMRFQGNAFLSMIGISAGAVLNIGLDPLLIFVLDMGTAGAALATMISQIFSFTLLVFLCRKRDSIYPQVKNFRPSLHLLREVNAGGLPSLSRQGIASVATIVTNRLAGGYGESAIAAFSVVNRIGFFSGAALIGFGQGFQPVCGFNYGAKKYERVKQALIYSLKVATVYCVVVAAALARFAPTIITWFRKNDAQLIEIGKVALRYHSLSFAFVGVNILCNMYLQTIRKTVPATGMALARSGLFFIPTAFVMEHFLGLRGLQMTQMIADFTSTALAVPILIYYVRQMMALPGNPEDIARD